MAKAPLALSPSQQAQLARASFALDDPATFTARVHERLRAVPEIGEGAVHRACLAAQRELFNPPADITEKGTHRPHLFRKLR